MRKRIISALLSVVASVSLWAQTNTSTNVTVTTTEIRSHSAVYDNNTRRLIYQGNVVVTNPKVTLNCERLTVDLPSEGQSRPTNVVAETNVTADYVDAKGMTNHLTANMAVYVFSVAGTVTNWTVTFYGTPGNPPKVETPQFTVISEPLVRDIAADKYRFTNEIITIKQSAMNSTNAAQMNIFK